MRVYYSRISSHIDADDVPFGINTERACEDYVGTREINRGEAGFIEQTASGTFKN